MQVDVKGSTLPVLEVVLDQGEQVISTHGELAWMSPNMQMSQTMGTGGKHGVMAGIKRAMGGGGVFLTRYEAGGGQATVAFAAKLPGRIFPVTVASGAGFLVHRHGWLCATPGVVPSVGLQQSFRGGLWGGEGFILEKLEGEGTAWVELAGETVTYDLAAGQSILVHPGHVGVFQDSVSFQITRVPGIANKLFGADGFHLVALSGPGTVWLQTMPLPVLAAAIAPYLGGEVASPVAGGVAGGVVGGLLGRGV
ncbi:MAG: AIM24 family protein [Acidimicrobiales bacterium]|nr:AIM24 family protein [Actinomycetota bacterium]MDA8185652.1 AIM24 family protein [Actinomycetota bacterium]